MADSLTRYAEKRDFTRTAEPPPGELSPKPQWRRSPPDAALPRLRFVIHKHSARRLHYDVRLELDGVLMSWAVPKGPSLDPADKRLAVHVEDHPFAYGEFEGTIPKGEYGAGPVMIWDEGVWIPEGDPHVGMDEGKLKFHLDGRRLKGRWTLVRTNRKGEESWLMVKDADEHVVVPGTTLVESRVTSIRTRRTFADIEADRQPDIPDAPLAAMPRSVEFELATPAAAPPVGAGWFYEMKLDGYRTLARLDEGKVCLLTRSGLDWTQRYACVATAIAKLPAKSALLDGEVVVLDEHGRSDFAGLVAELEAGRSARLVYMAFDLLWLDGHDLRALPLLRRKQLLGEVLRDPPGGVRCLEHLDRQGPDFHAAACAMGLEGTVAKRADAPYRSGRGRDWLKIRCQLGQEMVIVGWTDPQGGRTGFGALLLGYQAEGGLRYAGKVGTGFDEGTLARLHARLLKLPSSLPPSSGGGPGRGEPGVHWVKPELVAQVAFTGWSPDGRLRHPVFQGLREDKPVAEVVREPVPDGTGRPRPAAARQADRLTNPDRVYWPDPGVTKRELVSYYEAVAERMLPHVAGRPLTLVRCPDGHTGGCFFQRHMTPGIPEAVRGIVVPGHGDGEPYPWIADAEGLVGLAQMGVLEIHPWGVRNDHFDHPDRLILDLDPGPDLPWEKVVDAAFMVRERLNDIGLASFAKVSGSKGVHVMVPLRPTASWDVVRPFCQAFSEALARAAPERITAKMAMERRTDRVYLDYLRNTPTSTAVGAWSTRALAGASVSAPVEWESLRTLGGANQVRLRGMMAAMPPDPWPPFEGVEQEIGAEVIRRLGKRV